MPHHSRASSSSSISHYGAVDRHHHHHHRPTPTGSCAFENPSGRHIDSTTATDCCELVTPTLPFYERVRLRMQEGFVRKQWAIRALALLCACSLSVGAHFGREFLGPIKSRLAREIGSSNSDFSTILASYSVNNTWTPLVAGLLAARLGTSRTSLLATSLVFGGQCILMIGRATKSIGAMAAGLFFFGLGTSPVSVVQETIIVRFFATTPYLGTFLSIGLLMGKASGFLSAYTSYPLSELNPMAPFVVSVLLSGFSWLVNWVFVAYGAWMRRAAGVEEEDGDSNRMSASEQGLMRRREALSSSKVEGGEEEQRLLGAGAEERAEDGDDAPCCSSGAGSSSGHVGSPCSTATTLTDAEPTLGPSVDAPIAVDVPVSREDLHHSHHAHSHPRPHSHHSHHAPALPCPNVEPGEVLSEQATLEVIARKKRVFLLFEDLVRLGDVFWLYLAFNFLCGSIWSPFTHIAANLFQVRYGYSEADASWTASFLHAGSLILYPIAGYLSDRSRHQFIVYKLALISSFMTLACYGWLLLPVSMTGGAGKAMPGVVLFGIAEGFSTLLLVLMVPRLVPAKYIPTALGAHKSIESAGSTISLTLAGAILDRAILAPKSAPSSSSPKFVARVADILAYSSSSVSTMSKGSRNLPIPDVTTPEQKQAAWNIIAGFFMVNCVSVLCIIALWTLDKRVRKAKERREAGAGYVEVPAEEQELDEGQQDEEEEETVVPPHAASVPATEDANPWADSDSPSSSPTTATKPHDHHYHHSSQRGHGRGRGGRRGRGRGGRGSRRFSRSSHSHHRHHRGHRHSSGLELVDSPSAIRRGKLFLALCAMLIFGAWMFYVTNFVRGILRRRG